MYSRIICALAAVVVFVAGPELAAAELSKAEQRDFLNAAERHTSPLAKQLFTALGKKDVKASRTICGSSCSKKPCQKEHAFTF